MDNLGIYIHIPYCAKKCPYCDFFSERYNKNSIMQYTDAVLRNLEYYSRRRIADTIYFGGGTPSLMPAECIEKIINSVRRNFILSENSEITLEVNPNTVNADKLSDLYNAGVNRLSVGVQSLVESELKMLGRTHTAERAVETVINAEKAGFKNISCDMIIGVPNQTSENIKYTIQKLSELPVTHISSYILKIENGTPFDNPDFISLMPDDDTVSDMYLLMVDELEKHEFMQYEVSNFAKKGFESRHNTKYWKCIDYLGIGASAHSCFEGKRFFVPPDIEKFNNSPFQDISVTDENPCGFKEYAMLRLRLKEGLDISQHPEIISKTSELLKAGYINFDGKKISLTAKGYLMSNSVIEYLVF